MPFLSWQFVKMVAIASMVTGLYVLLLTLLCDGEAEWKEKHPDAE